ncbi:MAG: sulfoxide reductase heme-binding subunit YedZ [Anaerolineae bacterium]|nr:sulfoxide reductase heme-binding subunit YedZ [Anaerolineae bacterium]
MSDTNIPISPAAKSAYNTKLDKLYRLIRALIQIGIWLPLAYLVLGYLTNNLGFNPIQFATQYTGRTAITLLILSLACTPISNITHIKMIARLRYMLGVYSFFYAAIHFLIYATADYGFQSTIFLQSIAMQPFIWPGIGAFLILFTLALTSHQWWACKMGKYWNYLHRLIYAASILAVLHYGYALKGDLLMLRGNINRPLLYGIVVIILLAMRLKPARNLHAK